MNRNSLQCYLNQIQIKTHKHTHTHTRWVSNSMERNWIKKLWWTGYITECTYWELQLSQTIVWFIYLVVSSSDTALQWQCDSDTKVTCTKGMNVSINLSIHVWITSKWYNWVYCDVLREWSVIYSVSSKHKPNYHRYNSDI